MVALVVTLPLLRYAIDDPTWSCSIADPDRSTGRELPGRRCRSSSQHGMR
jgi:hypothetical protein